MSFYFCLGFLLFKAQGIPFFKKDTLSSDTLFFRWKNLNLKKDSLALKEWISQKMRREYFLKDTIGFYKSQPKLLIDKDILASNSILNHLNTRGVILRGVSFGNQQGTAVKSNMDLQISGNLSPDIGILASISDHNIPIQADGYTQTLDEFDKIYIQLNIKNKYKINAGHIDLNNENLYFGKYQRKMMGLDFFSDFGQENQWASRLSVGVARSEFHRVRFQGVESNQGPYKLTGKNAEQLITILSGSEQVYIDGILMVRGVDADYIINYNTAEIIFTNKRPIYRQNFITISYNYTNRNYSRFLVTGDLAYQKNRVKSGFSWFWESDNRNAPLSLNLTDEERLVLSQAGNDIEQMYASSARVSSYDVNKILYEKITNSFGEYYQYSNDSTKILYEVSFLYVGEKMGDYVIDTNGQNGRVFKFVGQNQGGYLAKRRLPAPERKSLYSGYFHYHSEKLKFGTDFSLSHFDANLFSSKDENQNFGYATRIFGEMNFQQKKWNAKPYFEYQKIHQNFKILDRINSIEFSRDFNLTSEFNQKTQDKFIFGLKNQWTENHIFDYQFNYLEEKASYKGVKNEMKLKTQIKNFTGEGYFSYLSTNQEVVDTEFMKNHFVGIYSKGKKSFKWGYQAEKNLKKIKTLDIYDKTSFAWREFFAEGKMGDSAQIFLNSKVYLRLNDSIENHRLSHFNQILGSSLASGWSKNENSKIKLSLHYRRFFYQYDKNLNLGRDFMMGSLEYFQNFFNKGFRFNLIYELGNGQEPQRVFQYVKVPDGQGIYKWTDYNSDQIQQWEEFELAEYSDLAQYIRVYTDAIEYRASNKNKFQFSLTLIPAIVLKSNHQFLKRWNFNMNFSAQNSFLKEDNFWVLNPFQTQEGQLLKNQHFLLNLILNKSANSPWSFSYKYSDNQNVISANGSQEQSYRNQNLFSLGYQLTEKSSLHLENHLGKIRHHSTLFSSRNYDLFSYQFKPKFSYQFSSSIGAELYFSLNHKERKDGEERLFSSDITGVLQWDKEKTNLRGSFSFIKNKFHGNSFSVVGNQMLDGLKSGTNKVWNLILGQKINSFLQLNLNYEGRSTPERTIHTGSVQLKALF